MTSVKTTHDLAHLVFCALVALHLAKQDGRVVGPAAEDRFLVGWLATAQRQRRFPDTMTVDMQWLQEKGQRQGGLRAYLASLWAASTGNGRGEPPLSRLVAAMASLSASGWKHLAVKRIAWSGMARTPPRTTAPTSYVIKSAMLRAFSSEGEQKHPVEFQVVGGDPLEFVERLTEAQLRVDITGTTPASSRITLFPAGMSP